MKTLADLEAAMRDSPHNGLWLRVGKSAAPGKRHMFFANYGPDTAQVYGESLEDVLGKLFVDDSWDDLL